MNVKPLGDKVLVKRAEARDRTESGLYLPESAKDKPREGEVMATGAGLLNKETGDYMPFSIKKGDRVLFTSYAGTEVKIEGDEMIIISEDDVLGVLD